jgi:hypothetical protein
MSENKAPRMKATARPSPMMSLTWATLEPGNRSRASADGGTTATLKNRATVRIPIRGRIVLSWRVRYAFAPCRMASQTSIILGVPLSSRRMPRRRKRA